MTDPIQGLTIARTTWSDEIPRRIVHSIDAQNKVKARTNWFTGIVSDAGNALNGGLLNSPEGIEAAEQLVENFASDRWKKQKLTKPEDIEKANGLIDKILEYR